MNESRQVKPTDRARQSEQRESTDQQRQRQEDVTAVNQSASVPHLPQVEEPGLTSAEVMAQRDAGQINAVKTSTSRSLAQIIYSNVFTLFNGIILAAMILVLFAGEWKDAVFGLVIIINTGIGIFTELKAKHTLDKLSILVKSKSAVRRDGADVEIDHDAIVLGDLLWVRSGEQVPADGEVLHTWGLELDESMLTGESRTVRKKQGQSVYSGSTAVSGMALVRVTAVGEHGYAAKLTAEAKVYKKTVSDLSQGINTILKVMTVLVIPLCILLIFSQMHTVGGWSVAISTGTWRDAMVSAVSGVVGMIPEGLVLLTSLNFAVAAMRLARQHTLVQELESVETLARVDALNLDKTGTITDGGIVFERLEMLDGIGNESGSAGDDEGDEPVERIALQALYDLSNEENPNGTGKAVLAALGEQGFSARGRSEIAVRVPFSSARKWSAIGYAGGSSIADTDDATDRDNAADHQSNTALWYMGAPEVILSALDASDEAHKQRIEQVQEKVNAYAGKGNRVLLLARMPQGASSAASAQVSADFADNPSLDAHAVPVALALCSEHIRDDAEQTLAWFREQGVRCRVISGDSPATVGAIAAKVKLTGDREPVAMDARKLPKDIGQLARVLEHVDVLGRVLPEQKKAIVQALHQDDHVVAMTGDGVNDALALKEADLGIAMGNAAPAAKAVAQIVLVDSRFSHLPSVVARGRQVMANMERVASLFLVKTVYSALISLGVVLTFIPFPYLPRHITYIGALTIGMPAFILALAPNTRRYIPGFLRRVVHFALPGGIAIALSVLLTAWLLPGIMGWNLKNAADLLQLRDTCAIVVFVLGVLVLARVARPLNSWRGVLVAVFAAAGVIGMLIPFVAHFFALALPTDSAGWLMLAAVVLCAVVVFAIAMAIEHVVLHLVDARGSRKAD